MKVNIKQLNGNWDLGYSLDKHTLRSMYMGDDQWGNPQFNTTRTEVGEALYQLKYKEDFSKVELISSQIYNSLSRYFSQNKLYCSNACLETKKDSAGYRNL